MPLRLPSRPNLTHLKREAKALLAAIRAGEEEPFLRLRTLFAAVTAQSAKLSEVQTLLAREYGFASWTAMGEVVERRASQIKAKAARLAARTADAGELAEQWFTLAEAGDLDTLWKVMGVGKTRSEAAQAIMLLDRPRYERFVGTVIEGLGHPNSRARFEYAHVLDSFGDARCVAPLRALMNDKVARVRWMAMHAITCHACGGVTCPDDPELIARDPPSPPPRREHEGAPSRGDRTRRGRRHRGQGDARGRGGGSGRSGAGAVCEICAARAGGEGGGLRPGIGFRTAPHPIPLPRGERGTLGSGLPSPHWGEGQGEGQSGQRRVRRSRCAPIHSEVRTSSLKRGLGG